MRSATDRHLMRILLVEDNPGDALLVEEAFHETGVHCETVSYTHLGLALKTVQHGASDYLVKSSSSVGALTRAARFALRRRPLGAQPADDVAQRAVVSCGDREHHAGVAAALNTRPRTWIEAAPPTAPEAQARQRRRHDRYPMVR